MCKVVSQVLTWLLRLPRKYGVLYWRDSQNAKRLKVVVHVKGCCLFGSDYFRYVFIANFCREMVDIQITIARKNPEPGH